MGKLTKLQQRSLSVFLILDSQDIQTALQIPSQINSLESLDLFVVDGAGHLSTAILQSMVQLPCLNRLKLILDDQVCSYLRLSV